MNNHREVYKPFDNERIINVIDKWVKGEKNRLILKLWIVDRIPFERIAEDERINLTPRYVKTLAYKNEIVLYEHLGIW